MEIAKAAENFMPQCFMQVNEVCKKLADAECKYVYTTSKSSLEMLSLLLVLLKKKRQETNSSIKVKQLEDKILIRLAEVQGDITEDRALIEELELSKKLGDEMSLSCRKVRLLLKKLKSLLSYTDL